jgi:hypothetical protein
MGTKIRSPAIAIGGAAFGWDSDAGANTAAHARQSLDSLAVSR